jgi:hypothetical protein
MPFRPELGDLIKIAGEPFKPKPFIAGWNRLEGRPRQDDFARALRAEVRDPLWFLARQWQFLELQGDDAGSPIEARLATRTSSLDLYSTRDGPGRPFPRDVPFEAIVEHEGVPFDRVSHLQLVRAFDKALGAAGLDQAARSAALDWMRSQFPFGPPSAVGIDDEEARQWGKLGDAHLFDAAAFLADADFPGRVDAELAPANPALVAPVKAAGERSRQYFAALYAQPQDPGDTAWVAPQLEYQFRCATAPGDQQSLLRGDNYTQGHLDWFCADIAPAGETLVGDSPPASGPLEQTLSFVPAPVSFAGMPSPRFWEMEDARVDFGALSAATTDIGKLLLTEFVLCYANDWCVVPLEVEIGSIVDTLGLVVHDVFGDATLVRAADRGVDEDWRRWAMFSLDSGDVGDRSSPKLFVAPATPKMLESPSLERVTFLRDEMANMCWAVERVLPSACGAGVDGDRYAALLAGPPIVTPPSPPGVRARYELGTQVPLNWRPFIPARVPGSGTAIRLQRARLPNEARPVLGSILAGPTPYFINEEAVPRAGRIVTRSFQRTRWLDGGVVLWLGRRSRVGRGEGSSGLVFDRIEEVPDKG